MIFIKQCREVGCNELTTEKYCKKHMKDHAYVNKNIKMYNTRWQKARAEFLKKNVFCVECLKKGKETLATEVDHIVPHKGNNVLFWDKNNWQALCCSCHSKKTMSENGLMRPPTQTKK